MGEQHDKQGGKVKGVWSVVDDEYHEKPVWIRLGTAFVNRDGSLNVYLDAFPKNGKLHIRDMEEPPAGARP